jgi:hypothetical protein
MGTEALGCRYRHNNVASGNLAATMVALAMVDLTRHSYLTHAERFS